MAPTIYRSCASAICDCVNMAWSWSELAKKTTRPFKHANHWCFSWRPLTTISWITKSVRRSMAVMTLRKQMYQMQLEKPAVPFLEARPARASRHRVNIQRVQELDHLRV